MGRFISLRELNSRFYRHRHLLTYRRNLFFASGYNALTHSVVEPAEVTSRREVPRHIPRPYYADTGVVPGHIKAMKCELLDEEARQRMREAGQLARRVLDTAASKLAVGTTTDNIDRVAHETCIENGAYPSTLNYKGFPKSICTSVNNVMCHGIPDLRPLHNGDVINIDLTVYYNGYHGDVSETYLVGEVDARGHHLVATARWCRDQAIQGCGPGRPFAEIATAIQKIAKKEGFWVAPEFLGHGIGRHFHADPEVMHTENSYTNVMLPGMAFTIEPILVEGGETTPAILDDDWTVVAINHCRSAQFEHTLLITETGCEVLTASASEESDARSAATERTMTPG